MDFQGIDADQFESTEKSGGRIEERFCTVLYASELQEAKEWKKLKTVVKIKPRRTSEGKTREEIIYYISDLNLDATKIAKAVRDHWGVGLHHALDLVLSEDGHIYRNLNGASNLSVIRKIVLAALKNLKTRKNAPKKRNVCLLLPILYSEQNV